jgi:hypothetical protein
MEDDDGGVCERYVLSVGSAVDPQDHITELRTRLRAIERRSGEHQESLLERPTKYDLDSVKDRLSVVTQQAVVAHMAAWNDNVQESIRMLERQVAAVRIGKGDSSEMSEDDIRRALTASQPSELLLKGVVSSEVRGIAMLVLAITNMTFHIVSRDGSFARGKAESARGIRDEV